MAWIPPNPRRVGYIDPIHGPLYMGLIYTNKVGHFMVRNSGYVVAFSVLSFSHTQLYHS